MFSLYGSLGKNAVLAPVWAALNAVKSVLAIEELYNSISSSEKLQIRYANLRV
jgi:hypothetical protein